MDEQTIKTKSKKKLVVIISVIAAVLIVGSILFFFLNHRSEKKPTQNPNEKLIIGTWDQLSGGYFAAFKETLTFNEDGTIFYPEDTKAYNDDTYTIKGDILTINIMIHAQIDNTTVVATEATPVEYKIVELTGKKLVLQVAQDKSIEFIFVNRDADKITVNQDADKAAVKKDPLKTANLNADLAFSNVQKIAASLNLDGENVKAFKTPHAVPASSFKGSTDPLEKALYDALKGEDNMGYVYIDFDFKNEQHDDFVQWSETEDGIIGQFPDPAETADDAKKITFGEKYVP